MRDIVKTNKTKTGYAYIDTANTLDRGWETMVFECDANGQVTNWADIGVDWYRTENEAEAGHKKMVEEWRA